MTLLGTVRKNRPELPLELVAVTGRDVMSTLFAYHKDATISSYCPKIGKVVILMSSLHSQGEVDLANPKKKPAMILEYNVTKGGVDTADKMLRTYSTKRMTRRWPVAVFSNMLDISALDAYIVWILLNPQWNSNRRHKSSKFQSLRWRSTKYQRSVHGAVCVQGLMTGKHRYSVPNVAELHATSMPKLCVQIALDSVQTNNC